MKVYAAGVIHLRPQQLAEYARRVESLGYDGLSVSEAAHDGFLNSLIALQNTSRIKVVTGIIVAFPRSPMIVAHAAWDLSTLSGGRFELGLGSQIKANIVERFSTSWAPPVPRMREYVLSLRAIWECWQKGGRLDFRGEHYTFTRMQPAFAPEPLEHYPIPIHLGAVGAGMTRLVGEVADGLIAHGTNSDPRYLKEVTLPNIEAGARKAGRSPSGIELAGGGFVATGGTAKEVAADRDRLRRLMGFLYSTPAYWPCLEINGYGDLGPRLRDMTREGRWQEMPSLLTDEFVERLGVVGGYGEIAGKLKERYSGLVSRIMLPLPDDTSHDRELARVVEELKS